MQTSARKNPVPWPALAVLALLLLLPLFVPQYYLYLSSLVFIYGLLSVSLNFVLGYGGMQQLHFGVFFGAGAYTAAIILSRTAWPATVAFLAGPLLAAALAFLIGWFCVRLRGLYFGMLTIALGQLLWSVVYRWRELTGGDDGIHGVQLPEALRSIPAAYYVALLMGTVALYVLYRVVKSPFGLSLQASRDNPQRSESIGIDIRAHRLLAHVIAGTFAGVAGVLFVILERSVSPNLLFWNFSAEILIMVLLGGMYTFWGPLLGAMAIVLLRTFIGSSIEYWLLVLGAVLLLIVLFLPQGVLGILEQKMRTPAEQEGVRERA